METYMAWLLRSSIIVALFYLVFQLLKHDKNFVRNRIFLLSGLLLAMILPLIQFGSVSLLRVMPVIDLDPVTINASGIQKAAVRNPDIFFVWMLIYAAGVLFFTGRTLIRVIRVMAIARSSGMIKRKGYKVVITPKAVIPFSFMNIIFMQRLPEGGDTAIIFSHERAHARQWHSIDVLLMELLTGLQWFNPLVWIYRRQLREVHEYLADSATLNQGFAKQDYLQLMLSVAMQVPHLDISNNFCQIKIKRRLTMITKMKNSRFSGLRFICTLALLSSALWLVSCGNAQNSDPDSFPADTPKPKSNDPVYTVVEDMPSYPGGDEARIKFIVENIKYPTAAKEKGIQGTVFISFVIEIDGTVNEVKVVRGIGGGCDEEAMRVVKLMPKWIPGKQAGKLVRVAFNMPIKFALS